jgi:hypothetical protein
MAEFGIRGDEPSNYNTFEYIKNVQKCDWCFKVLYFRNYDTQMKQKRK